MVMVKFRKELIFCILAFCCTNIFAQSITITENGQKITMELVTVERAQRLKELYESRYTYVNIMDSIEMKALLGRDEHDETETSEEIKNFREQIKNIPEGEYKVVTISMSNISFLMLGLVYIGHDYLFMVLFTNSYQRGSLNLRYDRQRYENIFRSSWNMLF
jgi:hypothetical protein